MAKYLAAQHHRAGRHAKSCEGCRRQQPKDPFCPGPPQVRFFGLKLPQFLSNTPPINQAIGQIPCGPGGRDPSEIVPVTEGWRDILAVCVIAAYEPGFAKQKRQCGKEDGAETIFKKLAFRVVLMTNAWKISQEIKNADGKEQSGQRQRNQSPLIKLVPG